MELWDDKPQAGGTCIKSIAPLFNRCVIFDTNKRTFHGHPNPWQGSDGQTRRSIALYYYTAAPAAGDVYTTKTDFQSVITKTSLD